MSHAVKLAAATIAVLGTWIAWPKDASAPAISLATTLAGRADVVAGIRAQNILPKANMAMLDTVWKQDRLQPPTGSLVQKLIASPLSQTLATLRANSDGQILQLMVMDARGALVAADHITHDYDQSDEPKWQLTVGKSNTAPVVEMREPQRAATLYQISKSVSNGGEIIGALTLVWCDHRNGCTLPR